MKKVRYKVPSQVSSGLETFNDNLVGVQITDGTSQLTNANFTIDREIVDRDSKSFVTSPFSDFVTLDDLSETILEKQEEKIKFNGGKNDAGRSLFGSLKQRINVSINRIIKNFPAIILVDNTSIVRDSLNTAFNITYNKLDRTTTFNIEYSIIYNPFGILLKKPNSNTINEVENPNRNFYSIYKNYTLEYNDKTYDIINYIEPNINNIITLKVKGNPFGELTEISEDLIIRPNNEITENFYDNLDDLESQLLNRETNPIYTSSFKVPRDSFDDSGTDIVSVELNWPLSKDNRNIQIVGIEYLQFINKLSTLAEEIDDYKSNIIVRFLTSPQLFEFDTEDKHAESIFQLYGQSFDSVKKYIDNIAHMRHVSYDGINNLPDALLKNLSNNLGLSTINLFDEKSLNDVLYNRQNSSYGGLTIGKNLIESEHEFYRRMLVNLSHIYKSKGTRNSLNFFLRFLGAPEPMIKIDEYVYNIDMLPNISTLEDDIYDVINGISNTIMITGITQTSSGVTYSTGNTITTVSLNRSDYPIDEFGLPKKVTSTDGNIFFQKGAGWYKSTLEHRSLNEIDYENSILTGRTKYTKTKNKPFTYGEDYFNNFKQLPGLNYGFGLKSSIDNKKAKVDTNLVLNRKNLSVHLSPSQTIDYDIYRQSRSLNLTFGNMLPQSGLTFAEYIDVIFTKSIKKSNTVKYDTSYFDLKKIYYDYVELCDVPYDFVTVNEFIDKMSPYWVHIVDQFIPSSSLWTGGNIIENGKFGRCKYKYKKPCQIFEIIDDRYPDFESLINEEPTHTEFKFYPLLNIDNVVYSGSSIYTQTTLPVNYVTLKQSWDVTLTNLIFITNNVNGYVRENVGKDNVYGDIIGYSGITGTTIMSPIISFEFFTNNEGVDKVKFKSYKYGPNKCTVMKNFKLQVLIESQ
jgi:hypothetical protein